jgi:tRNA(Ile2) C34 agmatinyltransferase TiaS
MNIKPVYKMVKEKQPHCPQCGDRLSGDNSIALPYRCSCGIWKPDYSTQLFIFKIEEKANGS